MIAFGRYGIYGGKKCFFTHRNPKNNEVWSDDVVVIIHTSDGEKAVHGDWVSSDKVKWL